MAKKLNYFNFYTEIEEYFWQKRGQGLLVSTLDWAIIESWQRAGIPLRVVLKGIDRAFEKYDAKRRGRPIKSLAYCVDAVADAAEEDREASAGRGPSSDSNDAAQSTHSSRFDPAEVIRYMQSNAELLAEASRRFNEQVKQVEQVEKVEVAGLPAQPALAAALNEAAETLKGLATQSATERSADLEDLERHMTVLEEKIQAAATQALPSETLVGIRREIDKGLAPYRRKMKAEQVARIETQFMQKKLFEKLELPRLSLFYLTPNADAETEKV